MKRKDKICVYLFNKSLRLEYDYEQLRNNVWFKLPDQLDLLEQIIAKIRLESFNEFAKDIIQLLE